MRPEKPNFFSLIKASLLRRGDWIARDTLTD